jgi:transcriptional regulator with XRE-family HTH domain
MDYAESIQTVRKGLNLTQADLAKRAGVNVSTVWRWENDGVPENGPARAFLEALAIEAGYAGLQPSIPTSSAA